MEEKAGEQWLKTCSKRGKKNYQSGAHGGNNCIETEHMQDKKEEQTFRKKKKKIVHVHLYTQNTHENLLTDDKDASAKVYNICSKSLHSFTNSLLFL